MTAIADPVFSSRFLNLLRAIIRELFPRMDYLGSYGYEVTAQAGPFVSARATSKDLGLPDLSRLPFHGAPGVAGQLVVGACVAVCFVNGDPADPYIAAVEGADGAGFSPVSLRIDSTGTIAIGATASSEVDIGGANARPIRDGEAIRIDVTGAVVAGGSGSLANCLGTIRLAPTVVAPGPPPTGYSRAKL